MNEIDSLTLKLLTTKKRYNNYLANANPDKSAEIQEYKEKVQKNTWRIKKLIGRYLDNPETQISNEIDDMMESCFRTLFKHFEMQDFEEKCAKHGYDATDSSEEEETLFSEPQFKGQPQGEGEGEGEDQEEEPEDEKPKPKEKLSSTTYWGKKVNKISTLDNFVKRR
jgi:hypothetical protein